MGFGFQISTSPIEGGINIGYFAMLALMSAVVYYFIRNISTNSYVPIVIGIALTFFTSGYLQQVGLGIIALGVSRLIEKDISIVTSS